MVPIGGCADALSAVDNEACCKYDVCTAHNGKKIIGPPIFVSRNAKKDGRSQNSSTNVMQSNIAHESNRDARPIRSFCLSLEAVTSVDGVICEKNPIDCHSSEDVVSVQSHSHSLLGSDPEAERRELSIGQSESLFQKFSQKILYNLAGSDTYYDSNDGVIKQKEKEGNEKRCSKMNRGQKIAIIVFVISLLAAIISAVWQKVEASSRKKQNSLKGAWIGEATPWHTEKGEGLKLKIINTLSFDWNQALVEVVNDWGAAPALLLSIENRKKDEVCGHVKGAIKVCNDDYGDNGWYGINEILYIQENRTDYMIASVAKMNDWYLKGVSPSQRQYVICHELGHGLGLTHRDEILDNADLGSCLDYTLDFTANMKPDSSIDFDKLTELYGLIGSANLSVKKEKDVTFDGVESIGAERQWHYDTGKLIHHSRGRRVFELHLEENIKVRTTVLLADKGNTD